MNAFVPNQIADLGEGTTTVVTFIWLVLLMNTSDVLLQRTVLRKAGVTLRTLIGSLTCVSSHVLHQSLFAVKTAITAIHLTGKLKLLLSFVHWPFVKK